MPTEATMHLKFATEYPSGALPSEAMTALATLVQDEIGTDLVIDTFLETPKSVLGTCAESDVAFDGGAVFGASLSQYARQFELAAIFRGDGWGDAEEDASRFRRIFEDCLHREGFRLLASVPMPPTGLWVSRAIGSEADTGSCRVRTYDSLSSKVFSSLGCMAVQLPFSQLPAALDRGKFNAVLSSGDGRAGILLSQYFSHYLPLAYSTPLCFLIVRDSRFDAMPRRWQRALKWAGREVQARYFTQQEKRETTNLMEMQQHGVQIEAFPSNAAGRLERKMELVRRRLIAEHALAGILVPIA